MKDEDQQNAGGMTAQPDQNSGCDSLSEYRRVLQAIGGASHEIIVAMETCASKQIPKLAWEAVIRFENGSDSGGRVFNTACFQSVLRERTGRGVTEHVVVKLLERNPRIVRLHGGAHWYHLPQGRERFFGE